MGGSQRSCGPARRLLRLTIFPCVALLRRALELLNLPHLSKNLRRSYYALEQRLILAEKQSRYRAAKKAQTRGELVLFERFPLFDGYGDAAPDRTHDGQPLESPLQIQYAKFNRPDVLIALSVSEELALKRKNDSAHISSELANKVKAFEQYYSTHKEDNEGNILVLDTSMEKQSTLDAALQHIWSNISSVVAAANADTS